MEFTIPNIAANCLILVFWVMCCEKNPKGKQGCDGKEERQLNAYFIQHCSADSAGIWVGMHGLRLAKVRACCFKFVCLTYIEWHYTVCLTSDNDHLTGQLVVTILNATNDNFNAIPLKERN